MPRDRPARVCKDESPDFDRCRTSRLKARTLQPGISGLSVCSMQACAAERFARRSWYRMGCARGLAAGGSMIRHASCVRELPDADHVSSLPAGSAHASAAGLAGVGSSGSPRTSRQRRGRCTGLDGVLCAVRGRRSAQGPLRAVDDGQGADLCLRDGHVLLARGGEEAGGGCGVSDARGGQFPATSYGVRVPTPTFGAVQRAVCGGGAGGARNGTGAVRQALDRRDEGASEREQAQGDEL